MQFKVLILLTFLTVIVGCFAKSLVVGKTEPGDKILYRRHVQASGVLFHHVTRGAVYPEKGSEGGEIIHLINVTDRAYPKSKKGGTVRIVQGGVNQTFAVFHFASELGRGINFNVAIYGQ